MKTILQRRIHFIACVVIMVFLIPGVLEAQVVFEDAKLLASDGGYNNGFGLPVSISGNTMVVGARGDDDKGMFSGSAYVFVRDSAGNWSEQAKLLASDGAAYNYFGYSVSVSGDTVVVGAHGQDSVYVFVRNGTTWTEQAKLHSDADGFHDYFGDSVSVSGDTVVVGAWADRDNGLGSGSAYVFVRDSAGNWSQQAKLLASDGTLNDFLGGAVSVSGDTVVAAAWGDDDNGDGSGSAYVFVRDSAGNWSEQAKLLASDGAGEDRFGASVSVSGDTVVVGASLDTTNGYREGSAYVFVRDSAGNWSQQAKLLASDGTSNEAFGDSVSVSGDTVVVGAKWDGDNGSYSGSAYVFVRDSAGNWSEQAKLLASDGAEGDYFGESVSASAGTVVVGAVGDDDNGSTSGSVYVFTFDTDGDGVPDGEDQCPNSDTRETVIIETCDSGVMNWHLSEQLGCTITDEIFELADDAMSHGQFVARVDKFLLYLQQAGILEPNEKNAIKDCASQSSLPY